MTQQNENRSFVARTFSSGRSVAFTLFFGLAMMNCADGCADGCATGCAEGCAGGCAEGFAEGSGAGLAGGCAGDVPIEEPGAMLKGLDTICLKRCWAETGLLDIIKQSGNQRLIDSAKCAEEGANGNSGGADSAANAAGEGGTAGADSAADAAGEDSTADSVDVAGEDGTAGVDGVDGVDGAADAAGEDGEGPPGEPPLAGCEANGPTMTLPEIAMENPPAFNMDMAIEVPAAMIEAPTFEMPAFAPPAGLTMPALTVGLVALSGELPAPPAFEGPTCDVVAAGASDGEDEGEGLEEGEGEGEGLEEGEGEGEEEPEAVAATCDGPPAMMMFAGPSMVQLNLAYEVPGMPPEIALQQFTLAMTAECPVAAVTKEGTVPADEADVDEEGNKDLGALVQPEKMDQLLADQPAKGMTEEEMGEFIAEMSGMKENIEDALCKAGAGAELPGDN